MVNLHWIPRFFYDVLGRVVPGAVCMLAGAVAVIGPAALPQLFARESALYTVLTPTSIAVAALVAYALGFILGDMGGALFRQIRGGGNKLAVADRRQRAVNAYFGLIDVLARRRSEQDRHQLAKRKSAWEPHAVLEDDLPSTHVMHDQLRLTDRDHATRLVKLQSEQRFCGAVAIGFAAIAIACMLVDGPTWSDRAWFAVALLVASISCYHRHAELERRFAHGVITIWLQRAFGQQLSAAEGGSARGATDA